MTTRYSLIFVAGLSLIAAACSKAPSADQYGETSTQDRSSRVQEVNNSFKGSVTTQVFDDGSTLTRDNRTGATSSTPWNLGGSPWVNRPGAGAAT